MGASQRWGHFLGLSIIRIIAFRDLDLGPLISWASVPMLLGEPFHFTFAFCFARTQAAPRNEAEPKMKQHALLQLILLASLQLILLASLTLPSSAKANCVFTKPRCVLLQSPFRFTFACCFSTTQAEPKSEAEPKPKQHGYGVL